MSETCDIVDYFQHRPLPPLLDVRSPGEYKKGHIPGAINVPLFTDEERAHVGTIYKTQNPETAYEIGVKYVTPKLEEFVSKSKEILDNGDSLYVHCWRGGQRSHSFAEHLRKHGIHHVYVLNGGYKSFRSYILGEFQKDREYIILGGYTGSGKTHILKELKLMGEQVIDLEGIAQHRGSAFGTIHMTAQPTTEQFSNDLYIALWQMKEARRVWIEDESRRIGQVQIPNEFFQKMNVAPTFFLDMDKERRAQILVEDYQQDCDQDLKEAISRITRKLGGQNAKEAIQLIDQGEYKRAAIVCLKYYDKLYKRSVDKRLNPPIELKLESIDPKFNAERILEVAGIALI